MCTNVKVVFDSAIKVVLQPSKKIEKKKLPKMVYGCYASGAEDQWTLKKNRNAFSRILFRPRILIDVSKIDLTTTALGFKIAPTAMQKMAHLEVRGYPSSNYTHQTTTWNGSNYANYTTQQYSNYTQDSSGAYAASTAGVTSLHYQER
ncbi:hypothetical protein J1N35_037667 [Gossypium stocksii]|uniref:FMN-dependent dehydrogenase domain-containing protein n=1 Tax=Gossypium stocksii TaxID=47602 RepID=A0A9D3UKS8_9ROSI|nr:hypothetical protein J1N35_037667 [Gossypium stocksii]